MNSAVKMNVGIKHLSDIDFDTLREDFYKNSSKGEWLDNKHNYLADENHHIVTVNKFNKWVYFMPYKLNFLMMNSKSNHLVVGVAMMPKKIVDLFSQKELDDFQNKTGIKLTKLLDGLIFTPKSSDGLAKDLHNIFSLYYNKLYNDMGQYVFA